MNSLLARALVIAFSALALVLLIVVMADDKSVVKKSGEGCGVFECSGGAKTKDLGGDREDSFQAAQAFGILSAIVIGGVIICHLLQFASLLPKSIGVAVKYLHLVAALFVALFWILLVVAITTDYYGSSLMDNGDINYGVFLGVVAMLLEIFAFFIYLKTAWDGSYTSF